MAEVKDSMLVLVKLLAHSLMTALFVIALAAAGTLTAFALGNICGGSNHLLCYVIWMALEAPLLLGIAFVVISQILNQTDEFFSSLRNAVKSIARTWRGIRKELTNRGGKRCAQKRATRGSSTKGVNQVVGDVVLQLKKTDEAA